ncbi:flagellar hook associated protein 1 [Salinibacter ruber M8]|uniref:Flagellar hook-associated protein 1 n=1 Tax=Salinibacter ruber (strain M8) TaxID=761659 RepID=D5HCM3_SALRM|nr:flagellar hook-associated protein FlgK [Salinibacter ruber]CBH25778.1 flagellar hook associated protein 1 [Salinibacter ruber M8]
MSVNSLFDIGSTSLRAVGEKIDATSQNIANAESEGYRRRRVSLSSRSVAATGLYASNGAQDVTSSGVGVEQFERVRDGMLVSARNDAQSGESDAREEGRVLGVLEGALATDTDAGLSASLQGLADGFSNLANNPESQGVRESVLGRARQLTDTFGRLDQRLGELTTNTENALASNVEKANGLLDKVASLNEQIESARAGGSPDYAAEDQRDQTVKELSKLLPVDAQENRSDGYTLTVDGMTVVQGDDATALSLENENDPSKAPTVEFGDTGVAFEPGDESGGEIGAQTRLLNDTLPGVQGKLDALADEVLQKVNGEHTAGYDQNGGTGENFFVDKSGTTGNTAGNIELNVDGPEDIAAVAGDGSGNPLPGDTGPAQNIADVASDLTTGATDLAAGVGTQVQEAAAKEEAQAAVGERVQAQIEDVSGVSVDQQLSSLIEQQQQFAASAQVLTTAREVSSTLLSIAR